MVDSLQGASESPGHQGCHGGNAGQYEGPSGEHAEAALVAAAAYAAVARAAKVVVPPPVQGLVQQ